MMPALPILAGRPEPDVLRTAHGVPRAIERRPEPPGPILRSERTAT
jgi:hypothetical protein